MDAQQQQVPPKAVTEYKYARQYFDGHDYKAAESYLAKAMADAPDWEEPYFLLSDVYYQTGRQAEAIANYDKVLSRKPASYRAFALKGNALMLMGKYEEALKCFRAVINLGGAPPQYMGNARLQSRRAEFIIDQLKHPVPFNPVNIGEEVNSKYDDYPPTFTVDGNTMYFTRLKPANPELGVPKNEDIMFSQKVNGKWTKAKDVAEINTSENEGAICIAPDGTFMVFGKSEQKDFDLFISFYLDGRWSNPVNLGLPISTRWYETQPSISYDGRTIYFVSDRPGGFGKLDIWKSTRDDNWNFGEPVNLGPVINSKEDDETPFIHPDDETLYFSSRGHLGMGGRDIFYSHRLPGGGWDSAYNIGYPINTAEDQLGMSVDREGRYAYFSSAAKGWTLGGTDIGYFELYPAARPKPVIYLKGHVFDAYTKQDLVAHFELVDIERDSSLIRTNTDKKGEVLAAIPSGKDYMVNVSADGYLFYSENISLKNYVSQEPYVQDIPLKPIKAGEKITLENVFFNSDSYELKKESRAELDRVVRFLNLNSKVKIEISGHTDNSGKAAHNKELSLNRAKSVYNYLLAKGKIEAERLSYAGYGDTQPVAPNTTAEGKAKNRRTEMKVLAE